jgi:hypothetical protein
MCFLNLSILDNESVPFAPRTAKDRCGTIEVEVEGFSELELWIGDEADLETLVMLQTPFRREPTPLFPDGSRTLLQALILLCVSSYSLEMCYFASTDREVWRLTEARVGVVGM